MFPLLFSDNIVFVVNASTRYQEIIGIGASVTDSSCININNLPDEAQDKLIEYVLAFYFLIPLGYIIMNYIIKSICQAKL